LKGSRSEAHLAVHLGSCYEAGKYERSRKPDRCEESFRETLDNLGTCYADLINLHYVGGVKQWRNVSREGGVLDLAVWLRDEGPRRSSDHQYPLGGGCAARGRAPRHPVCYDTG